MVVAIAAIDLVQLRTCHQSQFNAIGRSDSPTDPFLGVHGNLGGHAMGFNKLLDPGTSWRLYEIPVLFCIIGTMGPIPKSLETTWLSGVLGSGNCGRLWGVPFRQLAREPRFRGRRVLRGLGGSARL